jgi:His-Xaa-Ser system protein HxsD
MLHKIVSELDDGQLCLTLSKDFYQPEAIRAATYRFTDVCHVLIQPSGDEEILVILETKPDHTVDLNLIAKEYADEVLDQQVRLDLECRYGEIRKLIVKQAFAPIADLKTEIGQNV